MELTTVREIFRDREKYLNKEIQVGGWVRSNRDSKAFGFLVLHDGTFFETLQIVYHDTMANFQELTKINVGAAVIVKGTLVPTPEAKQPFEIQAEEISIEGASTPDYPLQKKRHSLEYMRTITHLRPRTNTFQAVFRVRSLIAYAIHKFFQERDFVYVHTPLITGSDCEGAGEMFQVTTLDLNNPPKNPDGSIDYSKDFFGKETNLTVSGQLNGETFAQAFRNIYTFGPTFRAENSNTTRHAAEFWMIEPEIAFADLKDDMILAESMLKYVINYVLEHAPEEKIDVNGQKKIVRIHEIHMEEDAGKLVHDEWEDVSLVDYNRSGVPLIEIVSEPDMRSADEVIAYLEKLRLIIQYLGASDCKLQEGSMRADVNLSVRPVGAEKFGTRTEMKNLNSFKAIARAIEAERARQIELIEEGKSVVQETTRKVCRK